MERIAYVENQLDIDLVCRTIEWIGSLQDHEIKNWEATRILLSNLCHFQDLFAEPLVLPFQLGPDLHQRLPVHRPNHVLLKFQVNLDTTQEFLPTVDWIKTLFELFEISLKFEDERKITPRRLVACWYHIACQLDYAPDPSPADNINNEDLIAEAVGLLVGNQVKKLDSVFSLLDDENYHSEDDSDYLPEGPSEEDDDITEAPFTHTPEKPSDKEQQVKSSIFPVVEGLGAYMPSPTEDLSWFKRSLKHIHFSQKIEDTSWYPWGCPPLVPLIECLKSSDPHVCTYAASILQLFKQSSERDTDIPDDDDENDADYVPS